MEPDPGVLGVRGVRLPREEGVPFLLDGVPFFRPDGVPLLRRLASPLTALTSLSPTLEKAASSDPVIRDKTFAASALLPCLDFTVRDFEAV